MKGKFLFLTLLIVFLIFSINSCKKVLNNDEEINADFIIRIDDTDSHNPQLMKIIGVISGPLPCYRSNAPDLTEHLKNIGINSIRNNDYYDDRMDMEYIFNCCNPANPWDSSCGTYPLWEGCDPNDLSNYNWSSSDKLFNSWIKGGFEPFLRVGGEYQCGARKHDFKGPQNETQENNWITAAINLIKRYKNWPLKKNAFTYVDIWTEWPNKNFYTRPKEAFIRFWAKAFKRIKDEFPNLKVGGPGLLGTVVIDVMNGKKTTAYEFLKYLYENNLKPDWIGWHYWSNEAENFINIQLQFRDLLEGKGDFSDVEWAKDSFFKDTEVFVDAYGYSKIYMENGELKKYDREELNKLCNGKKGASILTSIWIALQNTDVKGAYYYRAGDPNSDPNADWRNPNDKIGDTGLFYGDKDGTYKPTANAVRLWSKLAKNYGIKLKSDYYLETSEEGKIWVLAAKNSDNEFAVLITNVSDADHTYSLNFTALNKDLGDFSEVKLYRVNDNENGRTYHEVTNEVITIASYETHLLVLK